MASKRDYSSLTPVKTPRKLKKHRTVSSPAKVADSIHSFSNIAYACRLIQKYEYRKGFKVLLASFKGARRALTSLVKDVVRAEISNLSKSSCVLNSSCTIDSIRNFSWDTFLSEMEAKCPVLLAAVTSSMTSKKNESCLTSWRGANMKPALGMVLSMALNRRNPRRFKLMQEINAVEMWINGASKKLFTHLNQLGLCVGRTRVLQIISTLREHTDDRLQGWKSSIENLLQTDVQTDTSSDGEWRMPSGSESTATPDDLSTSSGDVTVPSTEDESQGWSTGDDTDEESEDVDDELCSLEEQFEERSTGYSLVWDNVGKMTRARHQTSQRQNKMMLWALSYAASNRVRSDNLMFNTDTVKASDIPLALFLPSETEIEQLKSRMAVIVARILVEYIPWLKDQVKVTAHLPHKYIKESSRKSDIINLGVYHEDPSTIAGTVEILKNLHQYVPEKGGILSTIVCFGDGLSCERHNDAHRARQNEPTPSQQLRGLEPAAQEFHKRMLLMQDTMDIFFKGSSQTSKGTLCHLKELFQHRNVKTDVGETFNHNADFLEFVTSSYVVLAAMHLLDVQTLEDAVEHVLDEMDAQGRSQWVTNLARSLVDLIWQDVNPKEILTVTGKEAYELCSCKTDTRDSMVECSGGTCPNKWYHLSCINMSEDEVPDDEWYCCTTCEPEDTYKYCNCKRNIPGSSMIGCDNTLCPRGSWFHYDCVSITAIPDGDWYCTDTCREQGNQGLQVQEEDDYKYNYVTSLMWCGLMDLTRKDAVRENDGPAIISHWRHDMALFHNKNHYKYVILGHRLLAGVSGWLPPRIQKDLIWNRTVNLSGGRGRNLEMDLVNEFLNRDFKESLKDARGKLTEETVNRHSQLIGPLTTEIEGIFSNLASSSVQSATKKKKNLVPSEDLHNFLKILGTEDLFTKQPGREFSTFPQFKYQASAANPLRLKTKLIDLSKSLDSLRRKLGPIY